jgi:hypothetical protein
MRQELVRVAIAKKEEEEAEADEWKSRRTWDCYLGIAGGLDGEDEEGEGGGRRRHAEVSSSHRAA